MPRFKKIPRENWQRARELRNDLTKAEQILWRVLRGKQQGVRFLRQHPLGPYIADFFSFASKLVIEVDGDTHCDPVQIERDKLRTEYLESEGCSILRFTNTQVLCDLSGVLEIISKHTNPLNLPTEVGGE
jgi:very-short-patch-repair endonuclease